MSEDRAAATPSEDGDLSESVRDVGTRGAKPAVACELSANELERRRDDLLPGLVERAVAREVLPDGVRWTFEAEPGLLARIAKVVEAERGCCRFLRFRLELEPDNGAVRLEVTGPQGTTEFLAHSTGA